MCKRYYSKRMLTPLLSRLGRTALNWTVRDLAEKAGVAASTVNRFELGKADPNTVTKRALQATLEAAGVVFIAENGGGAGVRLARSGEG